MSWRAMADSDVMAAGARLRFSFSMGCPPLACVSETEAREWLSSVPSFSPSTVAESWTTVLTMGVKSFSVEGVVTTPTSTGELRAALYNAVNAASSWYQYNVTFDSEFEVSVADPPGASASTAISNAALAVIAVVLLITAFQFGVFRLK